MTTQQQETAPATETVPQFGDVNFTPARHADDDELAALEAALAKEANGGDAGQQTDAGTTTTEQEQQPNAQETQTQEQQPAAGEQQPKGPPIMVPKGRLDQALHERDELRERLARLEGAVGALAMGKQAGQPVDEPVREPTPQERMEAVKADRLALAEKYEAGEISTKEWVQQDGNLQDMLADLRDATRAPRASQSDAYLEEQTGNLATEFPILKTLSEDDVDAIVPLARREAMKQGIDVSTDLKLRRHIASFAADYYGKTQAPGGKPQGQGQPSPNAATANAANKLTMARNAPPNLNTHAVAYSGASTGGVPSQEQFDQMSEDHRAALPDAVLDRLSRAAR